MSSNFKSFVVSKDVEVLFIKSTNEDGNAIIFVECFVDGHGSFKLIGDYEEGKGGFDARDEEYELINREKAIQLAEFACNNMMGDLEQQENETTKVTIH